jgi:ElaA protein
MDIQWLLKKFEELTPGQLYAVLQLRSQVFVVEQRSIFLDADDKDQFCYHLMGFSENKLIAYTRLVPPDVIYTEASIGRVVTAYSVRRYGVGKLLMQRSVDTLRSMFGDVPVKIGAQLYLEKFYEGFGFRRISDVYMEDGIEHIHMIKETGKQDKVI